MEGSKMNVENQKIPVPWGQLAVQVWGNENNPAIFMFHGLLDNVGTFERLVPLLPTTFYYICVDLPGHGQSSHLPPTTIMHSIDNILVYKILVDHFGRQKYIFIGHSFGAQIAILFAQMYPEHVSKLVMLDAVYLIPQSTAQLKSSIRSHYETHLNILVKLSSPPEYTRSEALDKLTTKRQYGYLTRDAAEPLLDRGVTPLENGNFKLSVDQRFKNYFNPTFDFRHISDFLKTTPVRCPVLILVASESDNLSTYFGRIFKQLDKQNNVRIITVQGHHDVHNNNPEVVVPHIIKFLMTDSKL